MLFGHRTCLSAVQQSRKIWIEDAYDAIGKSAEVLDARISHANVPHSRRNCLARFAAICRIVNQRISAFRPDVLIDESGLIDGRTTLGHGLFLLYLRPVGRCHVRAKLFLPQTAERGLLSKCANILYPDECWRLCR